MTLWLKKSSDVKLACLVKFSEKPNYRGPRNLPETILATKSLPVKTIEAHLYKNIENRDGMLFVHGVKLMGRVTGFWEVWTKDSETGKAVRRGERMVSARWVPCHIKWEKQNNYMRTRKLT